MMNTDYLYIAQVDDRISELETEIAELDARIEAAPEGTLYATLQANKEILDAELETLEQFSTEITRTGVDEDCVDAALDYTGGDLDRTADLVRYGVQTYATAREFGESFAEGMADQLGNFLNYIDFDQYGRDCLQDLEYHEHRNCIFIFNS